MTTLADGLHNLTREQYDEITDRAHWSKLKLMGKSPAHYRHLLDNPPGPDNDAFARGRITHFASYQPDLLETVRVWDGKARKGKEWKKFQADAKKANAECVPRKLFKEACALGKAVRSSPQTQRFMVGGKVEQTVLFTYRVPAVNALPGFEIRCKGMIDLLLPDAVADLKSTRDASPEGFGRQAFNLEYFVQAALYTDGLELVTGARRPYFLIAVEVAPPHVVQVYELSDEQLEQGREIYRERLHRLNHCRQHNEWLGYSATPLPLTFPRWATPNEEDASVEDLDIGFSDAA